MSAAETVGSRRLGVLGAHVVAAAAAATCSHNRRRQRVLVFQFVQEIATMNPIHSTLEHFYRRHGKDVHTSPFEPVPAEAAAVFAAAGVEVVPVYSAGALTATGTLEQSAFDVMAEELSHACREAVANGASADGVYFMQHGASGATVENDPEGALLERVRAIVGEEVPIVITLDLHGVVTPRMMRAIDGLAALHTYPHIDGGDMARRGAEVMCRLLQPEQARPLLARVRVPMLLRGNELITQPHAAEAHIKAIMQRCLDLEAHEERVMSADLMWGNPFTDVPELGCCVLLATDDGDEAWLRSAASSLAEDFWAGREVMQAALIDPAVAVGHACELLGVANPRNVRGSGKGTVVLTDASDATSSGATGNSNALLRELIRQRYAGSALFPIACPPSAAAAVAAGAGATIAVSLGGSLDPRYLPLTLEVLVESVSSPEGTTGISRAGGGAWQMRGQTAVLRVRGTEIRVVVFTVPPAFHVRDCFECHGLVPEEHDCVVIKTPHAQPEMYDDWCLRNFNCDCEGATSANVRSLGHSLARRPLYPLEGVATRQGGGAKYPQHHRVLGEDFAWQPEVEVYSRAR
eukprot:SAG11_NODE_1037_length_6079_cov_2.278930_4_plen_578_part_00